MDFCTDLLGTGPGGPRGQGFTMQEHLFEVTMASTESSVFLSVWKVTVCMAWAPYIPI